MQNHCSTPVQMSNPRFQSNDPFRPRFHFTAAANWINDPNGVCFHDGRYHLYYQHNPYKPTWGPSHWGHVSSTDLVYWQDEPIALTPSPGPDAGGCFSGSFALVDGQPTLYYTGYTPEAQTQCMAVSDDMTVWKKVAQPLVAFPPDGIARGDFRDPYVFRHDDWWYMVVGAALDGERGQCLLYRSQDGLQWDYRHPLYTSPKLALGRMWECPNFFPLGDKWVLIIGVWPNMGAHYYVGDFKDERFIPEFDEVLDLDGSAFAHLTMQAPDGRSLQWAWIDEQRDLELLNAAGWAGALSVPKVLGLDSALRLTFRPIDELTRLRGRHLCQAAGAIAKDNKVEFSGRYLDIEARFECSDGNPVGITLLAAPDRSEQTRVVYKPLARKLMIERSACSLNPKTRRQNQEIHFSLDRGEALSLRVLLDGSIIEVYANERLCLSSRVYPSLDSSVMGDVFADGTAEATVNVWEMGDMYCQAKSNS